MIFNSLLSACLYAQERKTPLAVPACVHFSLGVCARLNECSIRRKKNASNHLAAYFSLSLRVYLVSVSILLFERQNVDQERGRDSLNCNKYKRKKMRRLNQIAVQLMLFPIFIFNRRLGMAVRFFSSFFIWLTCSFGERNFLNCIKLWELTCVTFAVVGAERKKQHAFAIEYAATTVTAHAHAHRFLLKLCQKMKQRKKITPPILLDPI